MPFATRRSPRRRALLLAAFAAAVASAAGGCGESPPPLATGGPVAGWPTWGGDPGGTRHSPLAQIDRGNVRFLARAWSYRTGHGPGSVPNLPRVAFQATPVLDDGTLYGCTPANRAFALDAETGAERWRFDATAKTREMPEFTARGVASWTRFSG